MLAITPAICIQMNNAELCSRKKIENANCNSDKSCEKCGNSNTRFSLTRCKLKNKTVNRLSTCHLFKEKQIATNVK